MLTTENKDDSIREDGRQWHFIEEGSFRFFLPGNVIKSVDDDNRSDASLLKPCTRAFNQVLKMFLHLAVVGIVNAQGLEAALAQLADEVRQKIFGFCSTETMTLARDEREVADDDAFYCRRKSDLN